MSAHETWAEFEAAELELAEECEAQSHVTRQRRDAERQEAEEVLR